MYFFSLGPVGVLLRVMNVPPAMKGSAALGVGVLRRFLGSLMRGDGLPVGVTDRGAGSAEWAACGQLARAALRMVEVDAMSAPLVDFGPVWAGAPYD